MAKEQDHPDISPMVQPPIVALLFIVIAYFLGRFVPLPFAVPPVLQYLGLALAFLGFLLGIGAFLEFRKAHTTLNPHGSTKHLVTSGIYRFTRPTRSLGFLLMVIGLPLNSGLYWGLVHMTDRFGIDFGTTNSAIAFFDGQELHRPIVHPGSENQLVLPSLLYIDRQQHSTAGLAAAREYLQHETGRRATWEKRRVGEIDVVAAGVSYVQTVQALVDTGAHGRLLQYVKTALRDSGYDGTQVFDRFYTVDELIALILRPLKASAEEQLNRECREVVIGRPVKFSTDPAVSARRVNSLE